jgi:hypothetical protein
MAGKSKKSYPFRDSIMSPGIHNRIPGRYLIIGAIIIFWAIMTALFIFREIIPSLPAFVQPSYEAYLKSNEYDREINMGIYYRDKKIGSSQTSIYGIEDKNTRIDNLTKISLPGILGGFFGASPTLRKDKDQPSTPNFANGVMEINGYSIVDIKYRLKSLNFAIKSPFMNFKIIGRVKGETLEYTISDGTKVSKSEVPFKSSSTVSDGLSPFISMPHLSVGKEWLINYINPFDPSMQTLKATVEERTQVEWQDKMQDVFAVVLTNPKMPKSLNYTAYITPEGKILKQEILLPGLYLIRE